jgi:hypothetical protein
MADGRSELDLYIGNGFVLGARTLDLERESSVAHPIVTG